MTHAEKFTRIAENEQRVFDAGIAKGMKVGGYTDGVDAGRKAEREAFWDGLLQNGERQYYTFAFYGTHWTDEIYHPNHTIKPVNGGAMYGLSTITDTKVLLDLTRCANGHTYPFYSANNLVTIRELIVNENTVFGDAFHYCYALENLRITGNLCCDINLQWSTKLSKDSIKNVIDRARDGVLYHDASPAITLAKAAVDVAFETSTGEKDGSISSEWYDFVYYMKDPPTIILNA